MRIEKKIAGVLLFLLLLSLFSSTALANDEPPTGDGPKGQNVIMDDRPASTGSPVGSESPQTSPASPASVSSDGAQSQTAQTNGGATGADAQIGGQPASAGAKPEAPAASSSPQAGAIVAEGKEDPKPTATENAAPSDSTSTDAAQTAEKDSAESELAASEPAPAARQLVLWALLAFLLLMAAGGIVRKRKK